MTPRARFVALGVWLAAVLALSFAKAGLDVDTITRLVVLAYLAASLAAFAAWRRRAGARPIAHPRRVFVGLSLVGAMAAEAAYMISQPLHPSLLVTDDLGPSAIARAVAIDLVLTAPAYVAILLVIWAFVRRYRYHAFSFAMVFAFAQTLGDGNVFFLANPLMLLFAPYVMTNYWAMTFVPFLVVAPHVPDAGRRPAGLVAHLLPLVVVPVVYFLAATVILTLGHALGWLD